MSTLSVSIRPATILGALTVLAACGGSEGAEVSEGQALFQAHCMACHGETARGDGPLAATLPVQPPSILEHLGHHAQAQLVQLIGTGIPPAMPPAPLAPEQIQLVIDYVWTLVPEDQVAALRETQAQFEATWEMGQSGRAPPPAGAQEYAFAGTVQQVDAAAGTAAVRNDDVPGWMASMTMSYSVDPPAVLERLEPGDRITARVYAGDFRTLYGVEVAPQ